MSDINYLGDIPLGKIQTWSAKKVGKLMIQPIAMLDAGGTEAVDTLGAYEIIDIAGRWTGKFLTIQSHINAIKKILNGNQQGVSQKLQSPFVNNSSIKVNANEIIYESHNGSISVNTATNANQLIDTLNNFKANGVEEDDIVKNLVTGEIAEVYGEVTADTVNLVERGTTIPKDLFSLSGTSYAITASVNVKVLSFTVNWNVPGLNFCDYNISVVQVRR